MEKTDNKFKEIVNEFLTPEENEVKKEDTSCKTEECRMKNKDSIIERVNKVFITKDGRQLLVD